MPPASVVESGDARKLDAHYAALTERFGFEVRPTEDALNILGYELLEKGQAAAALIVFRKNVALYGATSANAHDSLGEALEAAGQKDEAAASYLRAWRLATVTQHPRTALYKEHLDRVLRQTAGTKK